uniref:BtpA/SgcQ family protein n=1 Tax=Schlesneria paludicola TaxID=360056 RepID=A0A7C4QP89_9PLAN
MTADGVISVLAEWSRVRHPIIGMLHAPPLPGAPKFDGNWSGVVRRVIEDAEALTAGGVDGLLLENFGDAPFYPAEVPPITLAALTALAVEVRRRASLPLGINVLRNDGRAALAVAAAAGAQFIRVNVLCGARVTDQGLVTGIAHALLRDRVAWQATGVRILADVDVKHSAPLAHRPLASETHDLVWRGGADAVIVSGAATGLQVDPERLTEVRTAAGGKPVFVGSGAGVESLPELLPRCDGLIVGSFFKQHGDVYRPVDEQRVVEFVAAVRRFAS